MKCWLRIGPLPVSGQVPVPGISQPVGKSSLLDAVGDPVGGGVVVKQLLLHLLDTHEPAWHSPAKSLVVVLNTVVSLVNI